MKRRKESEHERGTTFLDIFFIRFSCYKKVDFKGSESVWIRIESERVRPVRHDRPNREGTLLLQLLRSRQSNRGGRKEGRSGCVGWCTTLQPSQAFSSAQLRWNRKERARERQTVRESSSSSQTEKKREGRTHTLPSQQKQHWTTELLTQRISPESYLKISIPVGHSIRFEKNNGGSTR